MGRNSVLKDHRGRVTSLGGGRDRIAHVVKGRTRREGAGVLETVAGTTDAAEGPEGFDCGAELGLGCFLDAMWPPRLVARRPCSASRLAALLPNAS
jgi:hypothetical protein